MVLPENEISIGKQQNSDRPTTMNQVLEQIVNAPQADKEHFYALLSGISTEKFHDPDGEI